MKSAFLVSLVSLFFAGSLPKPDVVFGVAWEVIALKSGSL